MTQSPPQSAPPFDARALRDAFGCFMTGVTVVTALDAQGKPIGFTANSFTSVSIDPPLVLVSISNTSGNLAAFATGPGFAVNILAEDQTAISATFARPAEDRFANAHWQPGPIGAPILNDVAAWFDCTLHRAIVCGDHTLLIGRVGGFASSPRAGLGYYRGAYITPAATAQHLPTGPDVVLSVIIERAGTVLLVDDGRGGTSVPMARVGRGGVQAALASLFAALHINAEAGAVYAVYDDTTAGTQHLALRCAVDATCQPKLGAFVDLTPQGLGDISDPALRAMLHRLAEETRIGNFGTYFGTHEAGRVQHIAPNHFNDRGIS